jgi:hypothetical protein
MTIQLLLKINKELDVSEKLSYDLLSAIGTIREI